MSAQASVAHAALRVVPLPPATRHRSYARVSHVARCRQPANFGAGTGFSHSMVSFDTKANWNCCQTNTLPCCFLLQWACRRHWCCSPEKSKACGAMKTHTRPTATPVLMTSGSHQRGARTTDRTPPLICCRVCDLINQLAVLIPPPNHPYSGPCRV